MKKRVRAVLVSAAIFALFVCCAPAHGDCTIGDVGDALKSAADGLDALMKDPVCGPLAAEPGFWIIAGAVTAGTASSSQLADACTEIENLNADSLADQQKAKDIFAKLPPDIQDALSGLFGDLQSVATDLNPVMAFATCACSVAQSTGAAKILDVAGSCFKDALCGLSEDLGLGGCDGGPHGIKMVDCTKGVGQYGGGFISAGNGLYTSATMGTDENGKPTGEACLCPTPMKMYLEDPVPGTSTKDNWPKACQDDLGLQTCQKCACPHPAVSSPALGVCLCQDGSVMKADGTCPAPCAGSCPTGQIFKSALRMPDGTCVSNCACPAAGQNIVDGVCQWPPCVAGDTRVPSGACCAKTKVSACGECCFGGQFPDPVTGTCVARFPNSPIKPAVPNQTPRPPPFSPIAQ